jgi:ankyrin repeat protein
MKARCFIPIVVVAMVNGCAAMPRADSGGGRAERSSRSTALQSSGSRTQAVGSRPSLHPLIDAIVRNDQTRACRLILIGVNIEERDADGNTPLYFAARAYPPVRPVVELLLKKGADVNARCIGGASPLDGACDSGSPEIVRILLNHHARAAASDDNGFIPLHFAAGGTSPDCIETATLLLRLGNSPMARSHTGETPLNLANERVTTEGSSRQQKRDIIQLLHAFSPNT